MTTTEIGGDVDAAYRETRNKIAAAREAQFAKCRRHRVALVGLLERALPFLDDAGTIFPKSTASPDCRELVAEMKLAISECAS